MKLSNSFSALHDNQSEGEDSNYQDAIDDSDDQNDGMCTIVNPDYLRMKSYVIATRTQEIVKFADIQAISFAEAAGQYLDSICSARDDSSHWELSQDAEKWTREICDWRTNKITIQK